MKTKVTHRRFLGIFAVGLGCILVILSLVTLVAASGGTPTVNGLFYGDGDQYNYYFLGEDPGRGTLYYNRVGDTLYLAVVVDISVNDNVIGWSEAAQGGGPDRPYVFDALWGKEHSAAKLIGSDNVTFKFECGTYSRTWSQDYVYNSVDQKDPTRTDWLSDPVGPDGSGAGTGPPGLVSASSMQWNFNNTTWDYTLGDSPGGPRYNDNTRWKSVDADSDNDIDDEEGWNGDWYNDAYKWEWAMVYEMSIDVTDCGSNPISVGVLSAHNSPVKSGDEDVPICPDGCPLPASIGDYVWHDVNVNGLQDSGEVGVPNVTVNLYKSDGTPAGSTTTNSDGLYTFTNLAPGDYYVEFLLPTGYKFTLQNQGTDDVDSDADPTTGKTITTTLDAGETDLTWDAGLHLCDLGDRVWHDEDHHGDQNATLGFAEPGINGVDVYLYATEPITCGASGYLAMMTTITGTSQTPPDWPDGIYGFDMEAPVVRPTGTYWVCVDETSLPGPGQGQQWYRSPGNTNPRQVSYIFGIEDFGIDFGYYQGQATAVTLSSFAASSSVVGSASRLWLGLVGLTVLAAGSLFWAKRRAS